MATSGSYDWILTRDGIIKRALEKVRAIRIGTTPSAAMVTSAAVALNAIVKRLQSKGIKLWKLEMVQQTFTAASEVTGSDGEVYTCIKDHISSSATEPVTGANYTSFWVKRGSTGGVWADATPYSSIGQFTVAADTLSIETAWIRRNGFDSPVRIKGMGDYASLVEKTQDGLPSIIYVNLLSSPEVYFNRHPDNTDDVFHYFRTARLEDFDAADDDPDFPVRWIDVLIHMLAADISDDYDLPVSERYRYERKGAFLLKEAMDNDVEKTEEEFVAPLYPPRRR